MSDPTPSGEGATAAAPSPAFAAPPGNPRFPLFDGLRGIAVLCVLLLHSSELSGRVGLGVGGRLGEAAGGLGVIVFFVISGFLLYRPFAAARAAGGHGPPVRRYARRRALRILPAYWIVLTILAGFPAVAGVFTGHWWRYYGFLQAYFGGSTSSGIPVAWTLCVEVTFYLTLPLWAGVLARKAPASRRSFVISELIPLTCLAVIGLTVQILAARHSVSSVLGSTLPGEGVWFAIGMAVAVLSVVDHAAPSRPFAVGWLCDRPWICWTVGLAALVGLMAMVPSGGIFGLAASVQQPQPASQTLLRLGLEAIVTTSLILPAVFTGRRSGLPRRILGSWPLVRLGVISYSFYLWHLTIVEFIAIGHTSSFSATGLNLMAHLHSARMTVLFLVSLAVAVPISTASYRLFELPFLRRKERKDVDLRSPPADERAQRDAPIISHT
jgi:peptidoglycan/LPS O-acetylase OafA/YrhL